MFGRKKKEVVNRGPAPAEDQQIEMQRRYRALLVEANDQKPPSAKCSPAYIHELVGSFVGGYNIGSEFESKEVLTEKVKRINDISRMWWKDHATDDQIEEMIEARWA